jgi:hypothetical protein
MEVVVDYCGDCTAMGVITTPRDRIEWVAGIDTLDGRWGVIIADATMTQDRRTELCHLVVASLPDLSTLPDDLT